MAALEHTVSEHVEREPALAAAHAGVPDQRLGELTEVMLALDDNCLK